MVKAASMNKITSSAYPFSRLRRRRTSALRKGNSLSVVVQHVFDIHRVHADVHHAIAAIHGVTFASDKDVFTLREEDFFLFTGPIGKSEKLQIDRGRRDGDARAADVRRDPALFFKSQFLHFYRLRRRIYFSCEDVASRALILDLLHSPKQV